MEIAVEFPPLLQLVLWVLLLDWRSKTQEVSHLLSESDRLIVSCMSSLFLYAL